MIYTPYLTHLLQWGRVVKDAEMPTAIPVDWDRLVLQWGRVVKDAEMFSAVTASWGGNELQWGRVVKDAEMIESDSVRLICQGFNGAAS